MTTGKDQNLEGNKDLVQQINKLETDKSLMEDSYLPPVTSVNILTFNPILTSSLTLSKNRPEITGVTYNSRTRRLIMLDSLGCSGWNVDPGGGVRREMDFPKYQYGILKEIIYCHKFNVYFVLGKDFSLKVYNKDFYETFSIVSSDMRLVKSIVFNPYTDELITGGVGGVKFWKFKQIVQKFGKMISMSNYALFLRDEYPNMGGIWCTKLELDIPQQRIYCCCFQALICYNTKGKLLMEIPNPHKTSPLACIFSSYARMLLTCATEGEIRAWSDKGSLMHTFIGHSRAVTNLILHPETSSIFISGSLDGTVKFWSLDTMSELISVNVFAQPIEWIGLTENNNLYCCSTRTCHVYSISYFTFFWSYVFCSVEKMNIVGYEGKSTRVITLSTEYSMKVYSRRNGKKLVTVLPPPSPSPLQSILSHTYNRQTNLAFFLVDPMLVWGYTLRTDPACRIIVWDIPDILEKTEIIFSNKKMSKMQFKGNTQQALDVSMRKMPVCDCCCVESLSSHIYYTTVEGMVCADCDQFLLLGLQDGRILFLDIYVKNLKYCEIQAHKDPVVSLKHDVGHGQLLSVSQELWVKQLKIWSLPELQLLYKFPFPGDVTSFSRIDGQMCQGYESGAVVFFNFFISLPVVPKKPSKTQENKSIEDSLNHSDRVLSTDASSLHKLFITCGADSLLKVWDIAGNLMTEVVLDSTLSNACFLNRHADVLIAFKEHLFYIPFDKLMGKDLEDRPISVVSAGESFIYEDPTVKYELGTIMPPDRLIDMNSYLVPYQGFEIPKKQAIGRLNQEADGASISEIGKMPASAPSEIYLSSVCSVEVFTICDEVLEFQEEVAPKENEPQHYLSKAISEGRVMQDGPSCPLTGPSIRSLWDLPNFGASPERIPTPETPAESNLASSEEIIALEYTAMLIPSVEGTTSMEIESFTGSSLASSSSSVAFVHLHESPAHIQLRNVKPFLSRSPMKVLSALKKKESISKLEVEELILPPLSTEEKKTSAKKQGRFFLSIYKDNQIFSEKEKKKSKKKDLHPRAGAHKKTKEGKGQSFSSIQTKGGKKKRKKLVSFSEGSALTTISYLSGSEDEIKPLPQQLQKIADEMKMEMLEKEKQIREKEKKEKEKKESLKYLTQILPDQLSEGDITRKHGETFDWIDFELQRREALRIMREKRELENRERRILLDMKHMERMKTKAGHVQKVFSDERLQMRTIRTPLLVKGQMLSSMNEPQFDFAYRSTMNTPSAMPSTMPCSSMVSKPRRLKCEQPYSMFIIIRDTYAPSKMPAPTPLEKRLLRERFPKNKMPSSGLEPELIERRIYTPSMTDIFIPKEEQSKRTFIERFECP